jgi:LPS sulfotransferase NodH
MAAWLAEPERGAVPHSSVMICTSPRSGSWLLCEGLWRTGVAGRPEEYFRPDWYKRFRQVGRLRFQHRLHLRDRWDPAEPGETGRAGEPRDVPAFLREIRSIGTTPNGVFSIKCHWFQLTDLTAMAGSSGLRLPEVFPGLQFLRLTRLDTLRQAISWHRAITSDRWWAEADWPGEAHSVYDEQLIAERRDELESYEAHWDDYFRRAQISPFVVTYEELAADYEQTLTRVLDHLGLLSSVATIAAPRLRKQADAVSEDWVSQQSAICSSSSAARHRRGRHEPAREARMRTSVVLVDNFYANPAAVREYALKQVYYAPYQTLNDDECLERHGWMASRFRRAPDCPFKSSLELISRLEYLTGDCVDLDHWNREFPVDIDGNPLPEHRSQPTSCLWNCTFHLKLDAGQPRAEGVHNHVGDSWNSVGVDGWSGLIYLSQDAPLRGGLQLWRNVDPTHNYDWMTPKEQWELIDDLGNVANRLLLFRGDLPHSGTRGWGTGLTDGRLFQTFFFRVRPRQPLDGVLAPV